MKKCIHLTNENSSLRQQLERQLADNEELRRQLRTRAEVERELRERMEGEREEREGRREREADREWEKERESLNMEKFLIKKQQEELEREKKKLEKDREQLEAIKVSRLKSSSPEIDLHEQYTIKPQKSKPDQTERLRFKLEESQDRIRQLEAMVREEKAKNAKLCQFINREVPQLKDMMVELTAKLDTKVEKYLLRDHPY